MRIRRFDEAATTKAQRRAFDCGAPPLNRWLAAQADQSMRSRDAVTYLLLDESTEPVRIAGYFCLASGAVSLAVAPPGLSKRAPEPIPVIRMGRFGIDLAYQGRGWGGELLREALLGALSAGRLVGARAVLVDAANDDARDFYLRHGFVASPIHRLQLFFDLRIIAASAGLES